MSVLFPECARYLYHASPTFLLWTCLVSLCYHRLDYHQPGARSPAFLTHLIRQASLFIRALADSLMITSRNAITLRVLSMYCRFTSIRYHPKCKHRMSFQCFGFKFADVFVPLPYEVSHQKII